MPDRESVRTRGKSENMGAAGRGVRAQNKDEVTRGMKMCSSARVPDHALRGRRRDSCSRPASGPCGTLGRYNPFSLARPALQTRSAIAGTTRCVHASCARSSRFGPHAESSSVHTGRDGRKVQLDTRTKAGPGPENRLLEVQRYCFLYYLLLFHYHFIFIAACLSKPIPRWERQLEEDQRGKHLLF